MKKLLLLLLMAMDLLLSAQSTFINSIDNGVFGTQPLVVAGGANGHVVFTTDQGYMVRFNSCGESLFSRRVVIPGNPELIDFIALANGEFALLAASANVRRDPIVARLDTSGNLLWINQYNEVSIDFRAFPYSITESSSGQLRVYFNLEQLSNNQTSSALLWLDAQGNVIQSAQYNLGQIWGGAITTSDDGILFRSGNRLVKTDPIGTVEWAIDLQLPGVASDFKAPVELDSAFVFCGRYSGSDLSIFYAVSKQGQWLGTKRLSQRGVQSKPIRLDANSLGVVVNLQQTNGQINASVLRIGAQDLRLEDQVSLIGGFSGNSIGKLRNNFVAVAGFSGFPTRSFSAVVSDDLQISCTQFVNPPSLVDIPVTANIFNLNKSSLNYSAQTFNATIQNPNLNTIISCEPQYGLSLGPDTTICEGGSLVLRNRLGGGFSSYTWSTGASTPSIAVSDSGLYWLEATLSCGGGTLTDTMRLSTLANPEFDLGPTQFICEGENVLLEGPECSNCDFFWSNGRSTQNILVERPGLYSLTVQNANGCELQASVEVRGQGCSCDVYMPNAFSPNGDGRNEVIAPVFNCDLQSFRFLIYNRWGQLVFDSRSPQFAWDGTVDDEVVGPGIYVYAVEYTAIVRGEVQDQQVLRGTLSLLR